VEEGASGSGGGGEAPAKAEEPSKAEEPAPAKEEPAPAKEEPAPAKEDAKKEAAAATHETLSPAVQKMVTENDLDASKIPATGPKGNLTKEDVQNYLADGGAKKAAAATTPPKASAVIGGPKPATPDYEPKGERPLDSRGEERVKMSKLRRVIATRLKEAQNSAAMLTTFNEVDMGPMMELRNDYKDRFEKKHGVKLGFMSFFVKACVTALKELPAVNAEIDGTDIIYKNYYDMGVAVGTDRGLVVPVVRDADQMSLAEIEKKIIDLGKRARDGKLGIDEMQGATFTLSNGGVYGSLLSSPILNAPQSGILGMHKIQDRPVALNGEVKIRPMMYLALSYDHRIVDGKEAVTFLVRVKESLENPQRMLLDI